MNNTYSLQQISRTSNLDANLISTQNKLNLMADFMRLKYENPKLKQSEIANQLGDSSSNLQIYRNDINMVSPYKVNPNNTNKRTKKASNTIFNSSSHREPDVKRSQMTLNDLKITQRNTKSNNEKKNILNTGSAHENIEINDQISEEILDNKDI